jgi:hypothetical protein
MKGLMMNDRLILSDVDGVLLHWDATFDDWMKLHGYEKKVEGEYELDVAYGLPLKVAISLAIRFNESAYIGSLPPLRDSVKYVRKLYEEHGYTFHCITALPNTNPIWNLRLQNLTRVFGEGPIIKLDCTGSSQNKYKYLEKYKDSGLPWIEDKASNAEMGNDLGLTCFFVNHLYNERDELSSDILRVDKWAEIYEALT